MAGGVDSCVLLRGVVWTISGVLILGSDSGEVFVTSSGVLVSGSGEVFVTSSGVLVSGSGEVFVTSSGVLVSGSGEVFVGGVSGIVF